MIFRTLQLLILILGIIAAALIAACSSRPAEPARIIPARELERGLKDAFPAAQIILEDERYQIVPESALLTALSRARVPYRHDIADCDDAVVDALHHLRRPRYTDLSCIAPPAAGRLSARYNGGPHGLLWQVSPRTGRVIVLEPYTSTQVPPTDLQAWRAQDK